MSNNSARNRTVGTISALVTLVIVLTPFATFGQSTRLRPLDHPAVSLDDEREAVLRAMYIELRGGAPFSLEEADILRRWAAGAGVSELESDVLVSRALYARYVTGDPLTDEQDRLLDAYLSATRRAEQSVLDRKMRMLAEREAAERAAAPREPQAPPANDLCDGAEVLPGAGPFPLLSTVVADITEATTTGDPSAPSCQTNVSRSIWYSFTPSASAVYTISTCADAPTATTVDDTVVGIYTSTAGCAGPFTIVPTTATTAGCDDDSCVEEDNQAVVVTELTGGTTYYVVVWLFGSAAPTAGNTAVQVRVSQTPLPTNDTCAAAIALTLNRATIGTTQSATNDYQLAAASPCFTGIGQIPTTGVGRDVVYSFRATSAGAYSFRVSNFAATSNPVLYLAGACPAATQGTPVTVACTNASNRSVGANEEIACVSLAGNQQVFLFVDEATLTVGSGFTVEASSCTLEASSNDTTGTAAARACGLQGTITPAGDVDFFSLGSPSTNSRIFATVDGGAANSTDFDLRMTTSADTVEFDDADNDTPYGALAPTVAGARATGAASFLRVNLHNAAGQSEPYRLYSVIQPASTSATAESEPNGSTASADGATNNYFSGSLPGPDPSTDVDVYVTPAAVGDLLFVAVDGDPGRDGTPLNPTLELLDPTGAVLVAVNDGNGNSSTTAGTGSLTAITPRSPGEAIVYRVMTAGNYFVRVSSGVTTAGGSGTGDYVLSISKNCATGGGGSGSTGPGTDTIGFYAPSTNIFFLRNTNSNGPADLTVGFGSGTVPVPIRGDWNGDGVDTIGLYNPTTGTFFLRNSNSPGGADLAFTFGPTNAGLQPLTGDWNNDGTDTVGLYNPTTGVFFLRNANAAGNADVTFSFGAGGAGFVAIAGDWNNDGTDTIGLYGPTTGAFFLRNTNAGGNADVTFTFGGTSGLSPLAGDWNGDGSDSVGLYVTSTGVYFLKNTNTGGVADITLQFGVGGAAPLGGDWNGQ